MRNALLLLAASVSFFLFSCQKEITPLGGGTSAGNGNTGGGSTTNNRLIGTWKFLHLHAVTWSSNQSIVAGINQRTETTSDYVTINNVGTVVFTATTATNNNVGYAVDTWTFNKVYENNVLIDTFTLPMAMAIPPNSSGGNYTMITADSIVNQNGNTTAGAKLRFSNDTLFMNQKINETTVQNIQGVNVTTVRKADVTTVMKRQ